MLQNSAADCYQQVSLRDPAGLLYRSEDRIIRFVRKRGRTNLQYFLNSETYASWSRDRKLVCTDPMGSEELDAIPSVRSQRAKMPDFALAVEHPKVFFPSYPFEWAPEMLWSAGKLTLDLQESLLSEELGLKDATPSNILFEGPNPIFVDILSVEKRDPKDPTWLAFAQFLRTFVNPLLVSKYFSLGLDSAFLTRQDGIDAPEVYALCGKLQRWLPPFLFLGFYTHLVESS